MTFTDIISHPSKLFHSFSMSDHLNKYDQKLKRKNKSILNLFPSYRQTHNQQKATTFLQPPTSELSKSISNKSITFASVFDVLEYENNPVTFDLGTSTEEEDLIIIVPNKFVNNETTVNDKNTEPYPFRSEIPAYSFPTSNSTNNMISSSRLGKKLLHHHRPKKLRHPIKTIHCVNTINRSTSAPNLFFTSTTNDHRRPLKTFRRWFKTSSVAQFFQSFIKHPYNNTKQKSRRKSTTLRKYPDLIY